MDVTSTVQTIQQSVQVVQAMQAASALAAPVATSASPAPLDALQLSVLAGPLLAHAFQALKNRVTIPDSLKPYAAIGGMVAATASAAISTGTPWPNALGLGIATAVAGTGWHVGFLSSNGVLGTLQGFATAMQTQAEAPPAAPAKVVQIVSEVK